MNTPTPSVSLATQVVQLSATVNQLQLQLKKIIDTGQYTFQKDVKIADGHNLILGGTVGTDIGLSNSKIGFYGTTPVVQPNAVSAPSGGTTVDTQARTAITALIAVIHNNGLTK